VLLLILEELKADSDVENENAVKGNFSFHQPSQVMVA
jgi:hypothetical protein